MKKTALLFTLLTIAPIVAFAQEAKQLEVTESVEIKAPADKVWAKVNNFGDLGAWHPAVKSTKIESGANNSVGASRLLTLQDGGTIREKLLAYKPKQKQFSYAITEGVLPVSHYQATLTVQPGKGDITTVKWQSKFQRKDLAAAPASGQDDDAALNSIHTVFRAGLDNLKKIMESH